MNKVQQCLMFALLLVVATSCSTKNNQIVSPDGNLSVQFSTDAGELNYSVIEKGDTLIRSSKLGFELKNQPDLIGPFEIRKVTKCSTNETWVQPWGENKTVVDQNNEMIVEVNETSELNRTLVLNFKVFNDGVGFRYSFPKQENLKDFVIMNELTTFDIAKEGSAWWIPADYNSYEKLYLNTPLTQTKHVATPFTVELTDSKFISIHEAALTDYAGMTLKRNGKGVFESDLAPWSNGDKVRATTPFQSPWRTITITNKASDLVESSMILNLNEPCKLDDTSWIKPMKYVGVWWGMHLGAETWAAGPRHGATTENAIRYIDFAKKNNIEGVLFEGWNDGWANWGDKEAFDHVTPATDFDIEKVASYAKENNIAFFSHHETGGDVVSYERDMEKAYAQCERLGQHALKTGYAGGIFPRGENHHGQYMVRHYRKAVETAAKYKIAIDAHEPIKATGIRRTYPNMMTREGVRGMEWNAWSEGNPANHTVIIPFTRGLGGPIDYTPGTFDILFKNTKNRQKWNGEDKGNSRTHITLAHQLANFVILYSPLQMASDMRSNYEGHPAFQFFADFNADSDESKVLNGSIGEYITVARRCGEEWFLGLGTNKEARTLEVKLDFLDGSTEYVAERYKDADDTHCVSNPTTYEISSETVTSETKLTIKMAPGGGQAIRFVKK